MVRVLVTYRSSYCQAPEFNGRARQAEETDNRAIQPRSGYKKGVRGDNRFHPSDFQISSPFKGCRVYTLRIGTISAMDLG